MTTSTSTTPHPLLKLDPEVAQALADGIRTEGCPHDSPTDCPCS